MVCVFTGRRTISLSVTSTRLLQATLAAFEVVFTLFCSACAVDVANRYYAAERYPERSPKSVEILSHAPSRPFMVIADFQSRGESAEALRRRAAKIGADAIIVTRIGGLYSRT